MSSFQTATKADRPIASDLIKNGGLIQISDLTRKIFVNGRERTVPVVTEPHQSVHYVSPTDHVIYPAQPVPSSLFNTPNGKLDIKIDRGSASKAKSLFYRIKLSETSGNPVNVVPIPYLFNKIEHIANNGSGEVIQTFYPDTMYWTYNVFSDEQMLIYASQINTSVRWEPGVQIPANGSVEYYLFTPGSWIEISKPFIAGWDQPMIVRFTAQNGVIVSGSGSISLSGLDIILEHVDLDDADKQYHMTQMQNYAMTNTYLDVTQISLPSMTCNAGSNQKFTLQNLNGRVAFLMFCIRNGTPAPANNGFTNYLSIGDSAQIDIVNPTGSGELAHGSTINAIQLKNLMAQHFPGALNRYKNVYLIPFCSSALKSYTSIDGYMQFQGQNYNLSITFPNAPVNEVQTITLSQANTQGFYAFEYKGRLSNPIAFNATPTNMAAAVNSIPTIVADGISVSFNQTVSGNTSIQATFSPGMNVSSGQGNQNNVLHLVPYSLGTGSVQEGNCPTTVTTAGQSGWVSGSNYQMDIYAFYHKDITVANGKINISQGI